jgi:hypothetical protein
MNKRSTQSDDPAATLKAEIRKKIAALVEPARGVVTDEQIDEVNRLNSMLSAYENSGEVKAESPKPRWPIVLVFAATALLVALLLFVRVDHTEVSIDLKVSEVEFKLDQQVYLIGGTSVSRLQVEGIEQIQLWPGAPVILSNLDPESDASLLQFEVNAPENEQAIYLDPVKLPAGTVVYVPEPLQQDEIAVAFRDASEGLELSATLPVSGLELIDPCESEETCRVSLGRERPLTLIANADETYLDFTPMPGVRRVFQQEIPIREISVRYSTNDEGMRPRKLSAVLGGVVYFEALTGQGYQLRRGEHLELEFHEPATIVELSSAADGLQLRINGIVNKLEVGSQTNLRDLMPRWLVWLQSRHELGLFWGGVTYLFFLLLGVLRWWGFKG